MYKWGFQASWWYWWWPIFNRNIFPVIQPSPFLMKKYKYRVGKFLLGYAQQLFSWHQNISLTRVAPTWGSTYIEFFCFDLNLHFIAFLWINSCGILVGMISTRCNLCFKWINCCWNHFCLILLLHKEWNCFRRKVRSKCTNAYIEGDWAHVFYA